MFITKMMAPIQLIDVEDNLALMLFRLYRNHSASYSSPLDTFIFERGFSSGINRRVFSSFLAVFVCFPVDGQQFGEPEDGVIWKAVEHIGEPGFGVDIGQTATAQQGVDHGGAFGGLVVAAEKVVLPSQSQGSNSVLGPIVINAVGSIPKSV